MPSKKCTSENLTAFLRNGPSDEVTIIRHFGISQSIFSEIYATTAHGITIGSSRTRKYAIRRNIFGVEDQIPVYRVSIKGEVELVGELVPLEGNAYVLFTENGSKYEIHQGIPFFLSDLRPQGFLGRMAPQHNANLNLPDNIRQWNDDDVLRHLVNRSETSPGDIFVGTQSYLRYINNISKPFEFVDYADRHISYPLFAEVAMKGESAELSLGGEQPKFVTIVKADEEYKHVIVKFSPPVESPNGRRWADLLTCEHIALEILNENNINAARSSIIDSGGRRFLEVKRFDRNGIYGRIPMVTMSSLDGSLGMLDQKWYKVASQLEINGRISVDDKNHIELLDLFGYLIGNTDRHHGNIAFSWDQSQQLRTLPIYDMLPMFYRPNQHADTVDNKWSPNNIDSGLVRYLPTAMQYANQFWNRVIQDTSISDSFKLIASNHVESLAELNITFY